MPTASAREHRLPTAHGPTAAHHRDRCEGALLGAFAGDALGAPVAALTAEQIGALHPRGLRSELVSGRHENIRLLPPRQGQYTACTNGTLSLAASLVGEGGLNDQAVAESLAEFAAMEPVRGGYSERATKLLRAVRERRLDGAGHVIGLLGGGCGVAPVGLAFRHAEPALLRAAAERATLGGGGAAAKDAAAVMAAAVATLCTTARARELEPWRFLEQLLGVAVTPGLQWRLKALLANLGRPSWGMLPPMLQREADHADAATISVALWAFAGSLHSPADAVVAVAELGGHAAAAASITGALCGALHGVNWLPQRWVQQLENGERGKDYCLALAARLSALDLRALKEFWLPKKEEPKAHDRTAVWLEQSAEAAAAAAEAARSEFSESSHAARFSAAAPSRAGSVKRAHVHAAAAATRAARLGCRASGVAASNERSAVKTSLASGNRYDASVPAAAVGPWPTKGPWRARDQGAADDQHAAQSTPYTWLKTPADADVSHADFGEAVTYTVIAEQQAAQARHALRSGQPSKAVAACEEALALLPPGPLDRQGGYDRENDSLAALRETLEGLWVEGGAAAGAATVQRSYVALREAEGNREAARPKDARDKRSLAYAAEVDVEVETAAEPEVAQTKQVSILRSSSGSISKLARSTSTPSTGGSSSAPGQEPRQSSRVWHKPRTSRSKRATNRGGQQSGAETDPMMLQALSYERLRETRRKQRRSAAAEIERAAHGASLRARVTETQGFNDARSRMQASKRVGEFVQAQKKAGEEVVAAMARRDARVQELRQQWKALPRARHHWRPAGSFSNVALEDGGSSWAERPENVIY